MANFDEAMLHVWQGGKAWVTDQWDTDSFIYRDGNKIMVHCGFDGTDIEYEADDDEKAANTWECVDA